MAWQAAATAPACPASSLAGAMRRSNARTASLLPWSLPGASLMRRRRLRQVDVRLDVHRGRCTLSAPKNPLYGLIPNADWTTVPVA